MSLSIPRDAFLSHVLRIQKKPAFVGKSLHARSIAIITPFILF
jgi:hypothetical protein